MNRRHRAPQHLANGHRLFFPAAAIYGALAVPLWIANLSGHLPLGWSPSWHAHEMIAGYALAVVGGFLMTRLSRPVLAAAFLAWLAGRIAMLTGAPPMLAIPITLAYPVALFAIAGVPFLRAAKSGHNAIFGPLIGAFILAEALFWAGQFGFVDDRRGVLAALALIGTLMLAMGGRIIPAATAGAVRQQGGILVQRVQPRLEWAGLAGAAAAVLSAATGLWPAAGAVGAVLTGTSALARLARWRTSAVLDRPDLWSLHLGYLFLGLGWIAIGGETLLGLPGTAEWHLLGVGALGILANSMMVRATLQRQAEPICFPTGATVAIGLLAAAALLRLLTVWLPTMPTLVAAAGAWVLAHLLIAAVLVTILRRI